MGAKNTSTFRAWFCGTTELKGPGGSVFREHIAPGALCSGGTTFREGKFFLKWCSGIGMPKKKCGFACPLGSVQSRPPGLHSLGHISVSCSCPKELETGGIHPSCTYAFAWGVRVYPRRCFWCRAARNAAINRFVSANCRIAACGRPWSLFADRTRPASYTIAAKPRHPVWWFAGRIWRSIDNSCAMGQSFVFVRHTPVAGLFKWSPPLPLHLFV